MPYITIDDHFDDHRKLLRISKDLRNEALAVYARALMYCSRHLTDGEVPMAKFESEREQDALYALSDADLVDIYEDEGFFAIHDYLDHNRSSEQIEAIRESKRQAGRKGGIASGKSRNEARSKQNEAPASDVLASTRSKTNPTTTTATDTTTEGRNAQARAHSLPECLSHTSDNFLWLASDDSEHDSPAKAFWRSVEIARNDLISPKDHALFCGMVADTCPPACSKCRESLDECLHTLNRAAAKTNGKPSPLFRTIAKEDRGHIR